MHSSSSSSSLTTVKAVDVSKGVTFAGAYMSPKTV